MKRLIFILVAGILVINCSIAPFSATLTPIPGTVTPLPTAVTYASFRTATPMPRVSSFIKTINYPPNKFLFIETSTDTVCTTECNCRAYERYSLPFRFEDGKLYIRDVDEVLKKYGNWPNARKKYV